MQRNWSGFAVRVGGSLLVLAILFFLLPREQLLAALGRFSADMWLVGVSCYLFLHLLGVVKWRSLVNAAGADLDFPQSARCYYYGLFGNTFLPSVVGGDILRAGLAMKISRSRSAVLTGSVADRTLDSLGLALVAGFGVLLVPVALDQNSRGIIVGLAVLIAIGLAALAMAYFALPARRFPLRLRRKLVKLRSSFRALGKRPGKMLMALLAVIVLQVSQVVMNLWLGRLAMIRNATFLMWLVVWPLAKLAAMMPFTLGGIGVREAAQGILFVPFGVSVEKAVATGLIFQAIVISGNLLGGAIAAGIGHFSRRGAASPKRDAAGLRSGHRTGLIGALLGGGTCYFLASVLALAYGTGSLAPAWVEWMGNIPGYSASFAGACAGFAWGMPPGYLLGRLLSRSTARDS